jgi:hypothetical protein
MTRVLRVSAIALSVLLCAAPARAAQVVVGITSAFTFGTHEERQGRDTVPLLPVPLITLRVPLRRFEFVAEGVPPLGPIPYRSAYNGTSQSTLLSYAHAALRYKLDSHFSVGIGETLYNQRTTYVQTRVFYGYLYMQDGSKVPATVTSTSSQVDASRVPGMRFEVRGQWQIGRVQWVAAELAVTPAMHAVVRAANRFQTSIATTAPIKQPPAFSYSFPAPETGSEVDASVTAGRRFGSFTLLYGVRYLNYIAHFNAGGTLADRNTLVLPFIGFERTFGH